ncbi:MAG: hypothetical protein ACI85O_002552 [Saprospiraceae bacterium]|jgi:hypothetical protein
MKYNFQIHSINAEEINPFLNLGETELKNLGIVKTIVDEKPGYPCRLSLQDAEIGEEILLFTYEHHKVKSPYQSSGPIYVRTNVDKAILNENEIPLMLKHRLLSLRVYDKAAMMIDAHTVEGENLESVIQGILSNDKAEYMHVHNSGPGCYNCRVSRVS